MDHVIFVSRQTLETNGNQMAVLSSPTSFLNLLCSPFDSVRVQWVEKVWDNILMDLFKLHWMAIELMAFTPPVEWLAKSLMIHRLKDFWPPSFGRPTSASASKRVAMQHDRSGDG
ncbi:hypothetical protein B0H11DRAFT_1909308 [Mycena galericulata]|nr:hypothetical protein B0H11DRAFT_1909308 [Mycena galericulata]